ncbi:MAG TPA: hypothetical protein VHN80_00495 [Kineosporiaceae bacterium]|jgi:hypothetical protein|nr:hypothetical protein [Kineosporiaceae bacterium]
MTTLALRSGSARGPAVAGPLLRGPLPAWFALFGNVLAFLYPTPLVPIPTALGQLIAQGMLPLALVLALLANPGAVIRPNLFLILMTAMAVVALMVSIHNEFVFGSTFRAVRLLTFILGLWLLTPWWGKPDLPLLRAHLMCLRVVLVTVLIGFVVAPGAAISPEGRLRGALWPIPPTQVAHYAAVLLGCTIVLWFAGVVTGRSTLITLVLVGAALLEAHTRTALVAMLVGLAVAGASLFVGHARVRRTTVVVTTISVVGWTVFAPLILSWASRGQTAEEASQLTGRTKVWSAVFRLERTWAGDFFGNGLANKSFNGLPIDSNWVATYLEQGLFGMGIEVALMLVLLLMAVTRPRGPRRALGLFLVAYCLVASFTETGLGDASPYLLELTVAASLLTLPAPTGRG